MSGIPPAAIGSVLQSPVIQQNHSKVDEAARTARDAAAQKLSATSTEDVLEIEATDGDTRVHTDSGGLGSQGRSEGGDEDPPDKKDQEDQTDAPDRPRLDVTA